MKYFIFGMFFSLSTLNAVFANEVIEYDVASIKKLVVSNPKGEILINRGAAASKKIMITLVKEKFDKQCKFIHNLELGSLTVKIEHENAIFDKASCVASLKISMPEKMIDIDVKSATAPITLLDVNGVVNFKTATGAVIVKGENLKNIDGTTATSNMQLLFTKCSGRADIDLVSATGDAEVMLPASCKIKVTHKSATGNLFNELGESEDYLVTIASKSAGGSLKIKKNAK